jgi:hypothetical protein
MSRRKSMFVLSSGTGGGLIWSLRCLLAQAVRCPAIDGPIGEAEEVGGEVDDKSQNCGQSLDQLMIKKLKPGEEWKGSAGEKEMTRPAAAEGPQAAPAAQDIAGQTAPSEIADAKE